jgi:hypothetical protein
MVIISSQNMSAVIDRIFRPILALGMAPNSETAAGLSQGVTRTARAAA